MTTKSVLNAYHGKNIKIKIEILDPDENPSVLIEGDSQALEFLGNLLIEFSKEEKGCGFQFSLTGPGSSFFNESSKLGLYLHRTPCEHSS